MAKVHQYVLVLPNGTYQIAKSNGPICISQSRQEVGGRFDTFDPQLGDGFSAQYSEDGLQLKLVPNQSFEGIAGKVLIGRAHGTQMWGLNGEQREQVVFRLKLNPMAAISNKPVPASSPGQSPAPPCDLPPEDA